MGWFDLACGLVSLSQTGPERRVGKRDERQSKAKQSKAKQSMMKKTVEIGRYGGGDD